MDVSSIRNYETNFKYLLKSYPRERESEVLQTSIL